ncbi:MAG: helix-turn-helix transcriptional regulator [Hydrogenoanaerobacterium sp.]
MDSRRKAGRLTPYGLWVKTQAVAQGLSLEELASRVGIKKQYLNAIIHGARSGEKYTRLIVHELGGDWQGLKDAI